MRLFSRAFRALPLVAALLATPAAAAVTVVDLGPGNLSIAGLIGDPNVAPYYGGGILSDGSATLNVMSDRLEGGIYKLTFASGTDWEDALWAEIMYNGRRHYHAYKPDGSLDYGQDDPLQGAYKILGGAPIILSPGAFTLVFEVPGDVIRRYSDGTLQYEEHSHVTFGLNLHLGPDAAGKAFTWTVTAVPEPGTWALMITGFGLAGAALRRGRRAAVTGQGYA